MGAHDKTREILASLEPTLDLYEEVPLPLPLLNLTPDAKEIWARVASEMPFPPKKPESDAFTSAKRNIPAGHRFDPKALKPMAKMLWAMSVSLGHALTAYRQFTRLKSVTVSPDGLLGGRGYVMSVKDVRAKLYEACEAISAISDTIHDEINAPHWKPQLGELEKQDLEDVEKFVGEAEHILNDPEGEAEEEMEEVEDEKLKPHKKEKEPQSSQLPGFAGETVPEGGPNPAGAYRPELNQKQASADYAYDRRGNSSVNPTSLPGPRVDHLDRAEQTGPFGSYNKDEPLPKDEWGETEGVGDEYNYPSEWENDASEKTAFGEYGLVSESGLPTDQETRTEAWDWGIGRGNGNDAHGQGAGGYGEGNPSSEGRGVNGPRSGMPDNPGGPTKDHEHSETTPGVEQHLVGRPMIAAYPWGAGLPGDTQPPVARCDYYRGPKGGNDFDGITRGESQNPGHGMPAKETPTKARPFTRDEHMFGAGELPGDESANYDADKDLTNLTYKYERADQPYIKWDDTTHNMRPDQTFQRGPVQGPYVKQ